jgi:hypothetical protein
MGSIFKLNAVQNVGKWRMRYYGVGSEWVSGKVKAIKLLEHEVVEEGGERGYKQMMKRGIVRKDVRLMR